jgi:hypothetical protein
MPDRLTDERLRELHQTWLIESEVDEPMADDPPAVLSALTELLELREEVERLNEEIKEWKEYNRCRTD